MPLLSGTESQRQSKETFSHTSFILIICSSFSESGSSGSPSTPRRVMRRERISSDINLPLVNPEEDGSTPSSLPTSQSLLENMSAEIQFISPDPMVTSMPASQVMKVGHSYTLGANQNYRNSSGMELEADDKLKPTRLSAMFKQTSSKILKSVLNRSVATLLVLIVEFGFCRGDKAEKTPEPTPPHTTTKDPKVFLSAPRMVHTTTHFVLC